MYAISHFILWEIFRTSWVTSKFGSEPFPIPSTSNQCKQRRQDSKISNIITEQNEWFEHKNVLPWLNHDVPVHSRWISYTTYVTRLPERWGNRLTTSVERRLRRNSGSRRVAHCFYPQCVRTLVGVSCTDLRRDVPVSSPPSQRLHSGVTATRKASIECCPCFMYKSHLTFYYEFGISWFSSDPKGKFWDRMAN